MGNVVFTLVTVMDKKMNIESLNKKIKRCRDCEGLNQEATPGREATLNTPGYRDINSNVIIIGQSLCGDPCINSQIPFTGGCGVLLDDAFKKASVKKNQLYITNIVKCHPPGNRKSKAHEKQNCRKHILQELTYLSPTAIICLGGDARDHFDKHAKAETSKEIFLNDQNVKIHFLHHPPQYIKQWKRKDTDNYVDSISTIIKSCIA